jgi:hypothetical protein
VDLDGAPHTAWGKALWDTKAQVDVPEDVSVLGIKAGHYDVQRLVYYTMLKCYWNDRLSFDENVHVNFDWYTPRYAWRHTESEVRDCFARAGLTLVHEQSRRRRDHHAGGKGAGVTSVLITGSAGFIGRRVADRWEQGSLGRVRFGWSARRGFDLSVAGWTRGLPGDGADVVVHLAQSRRYREFPEGADDMFRVNVAATSELLEWSRTHGVGRFLFASTGTIYAPGPGKLAESAECRPGSMYAATKLAAELLIQRYAGLFDVVDRAAIRSLRAPASGACSCRT